MVAEPTRVTFPQKMTPEAVFRTVTVHSVEFSLYPNDTMYLSGLNPKLWLS